MTVMKGQRPRQGGMVNVHTKPPTHYNVHPSGVECIEVTRHLPFNLGNVVKYIWRAGLKENESEIKDLEKALDYLHDEIQKRKLALSASALPKGCERAWSYRYEPVLDTRVKREPQLYTNGVPGILRTDNCNPNARCAATYCHGATKYDRATGGPNAFVRMPYYYCLPCLVAMGELNADGSHKQAGGDK